MARPLGLPQNEAEAKELLIEMSTKMFPGLDAEGLDVKQAVDVIFKAWWERVFEVGRPTLEFFEKHVEPGLVDKVRNRPGYTKYLSQIKRDLLDFYESTKGKDRFGKPLPNPDKWPWVPAWWRTWYKNSSDLQKGNLDQLIMETFYAPVEKQRMKLRHTRYDPVRIPRRQEPPSFDPQKTQFQQEEDEASRSLVAKSLS